MTYKNVVFVWFFSVFLAGCGSMPKTPELLVENAKGGALYSDKEVFTVKRPVAQVAAVLNEKSHECLRMQVGSTSKQGGLTRRVVSEFTPRIDVRKDRTRLTLQSKAVAGAIELGDIPADGWYMLVADAFPVDSRTTRVEVYFQSPGYSAAFTAIKLWTTGTNMGCPDLTE